MTRIIGIYGAAGCGRGIMPMARDQYPNDVHLFIDDHLAPGEVNGYPIIDWQSFIAHEAREKAVSLAIADGSVRAKLEGKCASAGIPLLEVRALSVVEMDNVEIAEGACLSPFVTLTSNIRIGRCFHGNLYSYVEHDCIIGDFVTFAPGVKCNGNVVIEDHAYIGSGAILKQGTPSEPLVIGKGAVVGMGAVVTKSVPPGVTVVGIPARPIEKL